MNCIHAAKNKERERWVIMNKRMSIKLFAMILSVSMMAGVLGGCQRQIFHDIPNKVDELDQAPPAEEPKQEEVQPEEKS